MNSYLGLEALTQLRLEQLQQEAAMARLAAQAGRIPGPSSRQRVALTLRAFACRIGPSYKPSAGKTQLVALTR